MRMVGPLGAISSGDDSLFQWSLRRIDGFSWRCLSHLFLLLTTIRFWVESGADAMTSFVLERAVCPVDCLDLNRCGCTPLSC